MKDKLTKEEKVREEEFNKLFKQAKKEVQIKQGKAINLVEKIFSEPFQYLVFKESAGLSLKKFPYFGNSNLVLRINTDFDYYTMSNEYKYLEKLENIQKEYEKMFGKDLKKLE